MVRCLSFHACCGILRLFKGIVLSYLFFGAPLLLTLQNNQARTCGCICFAGANYHLGVKKWGRRNSNLKRSSESTFAIWFISGLSRSPVTSKPWLAHWKAGFI